MSRTTNFYSEMLAILLLVTSGSLQEKAAPVKPTAGSVSGKVFAITNDGDLKPARLAKVYLLFGSDIVGSKVVNQPKVEETPTIVFLKNWTGAIENLREDRFKAYDIALKVSAREADWVSCRWDLTEVDTAIVEVLKWAEANKRVDLLPAETDGEGQFTLRNVKKGLYTVIVRGQAGSSDALWRKDVWVHAGESVSVKVSSVEIACLRH